MKKYVYAVLIGVFLGGIGLLTLNIFHVPMTPAGFIFLGLWTGSLGLSIANAPS